MPDWTANENAYMATYRGEGPDDAPAPVREPAPEELALGVVMRAFDEAKETLEDEDPEQHAELDFNWQGEDILIRHIAEAIRAARHAA